MSEANENALSDWSMARAHECIEQYRDNRDYPAKAGAMFAMAIVLYNEAVRARARITELEALVEHREEALLVRLNDLVTLIENVAPDYSEQYAVRRARSVIEGAAQHD